jgi:hypothetical protein
MDSSNLLGSPAPTLLPLDAAVAAELASGVDPYQVVRSHPASCQAWATVAEDAWTQRRVIDAYAYARVGYHRGLDALRRNGWKGHGPVPASHDGNRGFLRCLSLLATAADAIGEDDEATRCRTFLADCGGLG